MNGHPGSPGIAVPGPRPTAAAPPTRSAGGPLSLRNAWPLYTGMTISGAAAVVASAATLADLATTAGWTGWTPWLLPAALDVGGSVGGWCWLRPGTPPAARRFGRAIALTGATATLVGNAAGHLLATGYLQPGPALVVLVGAVPAGVLVALAHLAALLTAPVDEWPPVGQLVRETARTERARAARASRTKRADDVAATRPAPSPPRRANGSSSAAASDTRAAVLASLHETPATVAELSRRLGRSRTTVVGHLTALADDGAIERGPAKRYQLTRPAPVEARAR